MDETRLLIAIIVSLLFEVALNALICKQLIVAMDGFFIQRRHYYY